MGGWCCVVWKSTCCTCCEFYITGWETLSVIQFGKQTQANFSIHIEFLLKNIPNHLYSFYFVSWLTADKTGAKVWATHRGQGPVQALLGNAQDYTAAVQG